ncbi:SsrA-binding protein SmpB [PVC group bacterium]|nr:SsrA-binding protein SmpB [PVC group bacterium]
MASSHNNLATNRKAFRDYFVIEKVEAGIELRGTEVKSVRAGRISLVGAYAQIENGEAIAYGLTIQPYEFGNQFNHVTDRPRRLLLHKNEILKFQVETEQKRHTLVPLSVYLKRGRIKVQIGLCKGKQNADKREALKRKTSDREAARAMASGQRR